MRVIRQAERLHRRALWFIALVQIIRIFVDHVGPDDGLLGVNRYNNHWNQDKPGGRQVCVHAFIGKLKDGSIATYQTLPWNHRGWHAGGKANDTHIGFEICEDGLTDAAYFNAVYKEAVELCVSLQAL